MIVWVKVALWSNGCSKKTHDSEVQCLNPIYAYILDECHDFEPNMTFSEPTIDTKD